MDSGLGSDEFGYSHDNLRNVVITATCISLTLSTVSVALRLSCRWITNTKVFLDDYLMVVALVFLYGVSVAGVVLLYNGLGTHVIYVPPDKLVVYLKILSTGAFLYPACITFIKLSILALYKRLFPIRTMVISVYSVGLVVILWGFGVCLIGAVTCIPLRKMWEPETPGGCINLTQFYYGLQVPNILTDAIILVMPLKVVWNLQVPLRRKIALSGVFLLGLLTLAFDVVRLVVMIELSMAGADITYNQVPASVWTCIEPTIGITAACLANMRPLFQKLRVPLRRPPIPSIGGKEKLARSKNTIESTTVVEIESHSRDRGSRKESV